MTAPPAGPRRAAGDPAVLPATLSARFLILFVLILATTASVWGYLGVRLGRPGETRVAACLQGTGLAGLPSYQPGAPPALIGDTVPVIACVAPDIPLIVWSSLAGPAALMACALTGYALATPWRLWRRRGRLRPLHTYDPAAAAKIDELIEGYGLPRHPVVMVAPAARDSFVFGTARRPLLCVAGETARKHARDPARFTGVVLHELAHLKNRDTGPTLLLGTAWRSFLALAAVPYLALLAADLTGLTPRITLFRHDDLHTMAAIAVLLTLVALTRQAVLRDRELTADATAGRHPSGAATLAYLTTLRTPPATSTASRDPGARSPRRAALSWGAVAAFGRRAAARARRPRVLSTHPDIALRLRVAAEPWTLPSLSVAQLFGAGVGLAVLCQDAGTLAWQALIAAGVDPVPGPRMTFLLIMVVALATAGPIGALAWLVNVTAWQRRLTTARPPVAALALGLGAGMLAGEPAAVSAANASRWGVFDGVGDGAAGPAVVSALALIGILAALARWSWDNAGAWLPTIRGSLRRASRRSAVIGALAVLPWYATWWAMHDTPLHGRLYLWTPGFAEALTYGYLPLPAAEWLQITYIPWDMLGWAPGVAALTVLPVLVTTAGLLRSRTPRTPAWLTHATLPVSPRPPDPGHRRAADSAGRAAAPSRPGHVPGTDDAESLTASSPGPGHSLTAPAHDSTRTAGPGHLTGADNAGHLAPPPESGHSPDADSAGRISRPPDHRPSLGRAVLIGLVGAVVLLVAGTVLATAAHGTISGVYRQDRANLTGFLHYLMSTATLLTTAAGALAAAVTTAAHRSRSVVAGLVSALVVALAGAVATPALIGVAACGLPVGPGCLSDDPLDGYLILFGMAGTAQPVKAVIAGMMAAGLVATARRRPPTTERTPMRRTATVLISSGIVAALAVLSAATWLNLE
ncbi:M48 family metalloprotease [Actinoplanes philippinensis]|uniref:M48 family metalloprotease n=1 Tax=Actinoplanes philippinensis TaxID=35752 RepID=UPI0033D20B04